ncbi:MAG: hypothetical protein KAW47_01210 [Thermoplasmatales archaeon]|nr:hypothetical protein [Thermoplasmatales archaeon]
MKYNKECQNGYQLFDGIHFDIECNDIDIDDYANLLTGIKDRAYEGETIASQGMILGIDTRLGWEDETVHYTDMLLNTDIDFITVMAYRNATDEIVNVAKDELKAASNHGKSCVIAVETGPTSEPERVTFYEEGKEALESSLTAVMNNDIVKNEPSFAGFAIHHYVPYKSMYMQAEITKCIMPSGAYEEGDKVEAEVTVKNTGDLSHRFYVGFSVRDPNGKWWDAPYKSTYLDAGESSIVAVSWTVDSEAPSGSYDALVRVWGFEQFNVTGKKKFHLYDMKDEELKEDMFSVGEPSTEFQIGMFVFPESITTELPTKLKDNGVTRIFVLAYDAKTKTKEDVFYPKKNGDLKFLNYQDAYNLSTLLTEAHNLDIEVHAVVSCFGPDPVDPTGVSGLNQQTKLFSVCDYLLSNYKDSNGRGLDGIHLDFVRFVKPYNAEGDASNISIMSTFIKNLKEQVVKNRAKLSASVMAADHEYSWLCLGRKYCWAGAYDSVKNDCGQDYTKMSENLDFISPMAYHYSKYYNSDPDYVGSVTKFVKGKIIDDDCDVIPDIQGFYVFKCNKTTKKCCMPAVSYCGNFKCDLNKDCEEYCLQDEPGFEQIYNALNSAKRNGAKGANVFRYIHLSGDEWLAIWCYLNDHDQLISASINCSANLHAYDSQGRHVGVNKLGNIDLEIPGAYYTSPDSEPERIIIPGQSDGIVFKVEALDAGEFNFTLTQSTDTKTTTLTYSNVSIIQTTEATVDVSEANPNYLMEIDYDGDGTTDYTIEPDSAETPGQISYSIQLHTGWNLISLPIMPDDSDVLDVMSSVDGNWNSVWSYEGGKWKRYDLTGPDFLNDLTTIEPGKGYWINMKSDDTLSVSGSEPTIKSISLSAGWNLVGYNSLSSMSTTDAMSSVDGNWNSVWSYEDGNWKRYDLTGPGFLNDLTTMEPGNGYWINMKSSDTWTLGA